MHYSIVIAVAAEHGLDLRALQLDDEAAYDCAVGWLVCQHPNLPGRGTRLPPMRRCAWLSALSRHMYAIVSRRMPRSLLAAPESNPPRGHRGPARAIRRPALQVLRSLHYAQDFQRIRLRRYMGGRVSPRVLIVRGEATPRPAPRTLPETARCGPGVVALASAGG
jgi:hypothetical protein